MHQSGITPLCPGFSIQSNFIESLSASVEEDYTVVCSTLQFPANLNPTEIWTYLDRTEIRRCTIWLFNPFEHHSYHLSYSLLQWRHINLSVKSLFCTNFSFKYTIWSICQPRDVNYWESIACSKIEGNIAINCEKRWIVWWKNYQVVYGPSWYLRWGDGTKSYI